jgi:hypothetical protein
MRFRRPVKAEPARPSLDDEVLVICCEAFQPAAVARLVERGTWRRFGDPVVQAHRANFAVRLSDLEQGWGDEEDGGA